MGCFLSALIFVLTIPILKAQSEMSVTIEGDASTAPIYTMEGHAISQFRIDDYMDVKSDFQYSMDNVNSGLVSCVGTDKITTDPGTVEPWDGTFDVVTIYTIKQYGKSITASFNHLLHSKGVVIKNGKSAASATVSSRGSMQLQKNFTFYGSMKGQIIAKDSLGNIIDNHNYPTDHTCNFTQTFSDVSTSDWGVWTGDYTLNRFINILSGTGVATFGPIKDPVDTVAQNLKGTVSKSGIFSWSTTSTSKADNKVKLTIKHNSYDQLVNGQNSVNAAAQSRKF